MSAGTEPGEPTMEQEKRTGAGKGDGRAAEVIRPAGDVPAGDVPVGDVPVGTYEGAADVAQAAIRRTRARHPDGRDPFGVVVAAKFLGRLAQLDLTALGGAIREWHHAVVTGGDSWFAAESAVARAIAAGGRYAEQEALLGHIAQLFRQAPWFKPQMPGARVGATEPSGQYVATTAMLALLVRDQIEPHELELLYRPFATLIPIEELELE